MKLKLFTYILCTFSFLQIFNYINCRKIGQSELNAFESIFSKFNWQFWFTIIFITVIQILAVQWFHAFTRTTPLTREEWGACIIAGSTVLLVAPMLKLTGSAVLKRIPFTKFIDEDREMEDGFVDKVMAVSSA